MMELLPRGGGNGTTNDPCAGLAHRELTRPPIPQSFIDANLGLFYFFLVLFVLCIAGTVKYRNHARFVKVRPPALSFAAFLACFIFFSGCTIAIALQWPCIYILVGIVFGSGLVSTNVVMRCMVISLEAQYAKLLAATRVVKPLDPQQNPVDPDGGESTTAFDASSYSSFSWSRRTGDRLRATHNLNMLVYFGRSLDQLSLQEVVQAKSNYGLFSFLFVFPALLVVLVVVFAVPPMYLCVEQCNEVFLEMQLGMIIVQVYFVAFGVNLVRIMYVQIGADDDKGVFKEIAIMVLFVASSLVPAMILCVVDPGDLALQREFNWHILVGLPVLAYMWITFAHQIIMAALQDARRAHEDAAAAKDVDSTKMNVLSDMVSILERNSEVRTQFAAFAITQYVVESVAFLETVQQYKQMYYDKSDSWRAHKVRLLIKNYIQVGTAMEVNIAAKTRERILQRAGVNGGDKTTPTTDLFDLFDAAYDEVRDMVQHGAWRDFVRTRPELTSTMAVFSTSTMQGGGGDKPARSSFMAL